nr:hypothetical protein GCM10020185_66790 [Pseudomonas brassicacearum subsp. brassicacearum]
MPWRKRELSADLVKIVGHGSQRLIETEGHVPDLTGEDGEDGRALHAGFLAREKSHEEHNGKRKKAKDWHGLENIQGGQDNDCSLAAFGGQRGDDQGKKQTKRTRR